MQGANLTWDTLGGNLTNVLKVARNETHRIDNSPTTLFTSDNLGETLRYAYTGTYRFGVPGLGNAVTWLVEREDESFTPNSSSSDPFFPFADDGIPRERERLSYAGEWRGDIADRLFVTAGVRRDDNDTFEDFTTWRTTATLQLPEIGLRPHASAGTAVKSPTMFEQFGTIPLFFTPNPDLIPEESFGWDAGVEFAFGSRRTVLDVTYFESEIENQINGFAPGPGGTFTSVNREGVGHRKGVEVAGSWEIFRGLTLSGAYSLRGGPRADQCGGHLQRRHG
jgi:vitamin B12 transporter